MNNSCGARTPLASMISGLAVMVVLLCLTTVFKNMSNNAQVGNRTVLRAGCDLLIRSHAGFVLHNAPPLHVGSIRLASQSAWLDRMLLQTSACVASAGRDHHLRRHHPL